MLMTLRKQRSWIDRRKSVVFPSSENLFVGRGQNENFQDDLQKYKLHGMLWHRTRNTARSLNLFFKCQRFSYRFLRGRVRVAPGQIKWAFLSIALGPFIYTQSVDRLVFCSGFCDNVQNSDEKTLDTSGLAESFLGKCARLSPLQGRTKTERV